MTKNSNKLKRLINLLYPLKGVFKKTEDHEENQIFMPLSYKKSKKEKINLKFLSNNSFIMQSDTENIKIENIEEFFSLKNHNLSQGSFSSSFLFFLNNILITNSLTPSEYNPQPFART